MQGCWCDGRSTRCVPLPFASPRALSAARNGAGTETRPLASNLFWWVPRKWVILPGPPFLPDAASADHPSRPAGASNGVQSKRAACQSPGSDRAHGMSPSSSLGWHGITWEIMGRQRDYAGSSYRCAPNSRALVNSLGWRFDSGPNFDGSRISRMLIPVSFPVWTSWKRSVAERWCQTACKPGSVRASRESRCAGRPFLWDAPCGAPHATNPGGGAGMSPCLPRQAGRPYSVLLPVGFTLPPPLPGARCALTAPFHPCPRAALRRLRGRFVFCGTFPGVAPAGR